MRYARLGIYMLSALATSANADQFCFALATTYYEQIYCQLQAKAQTKNLPPFNQFKKNTEVVQASLLRRPAERNGIKLPAPLRKVQPPTTALTSLKTISVPQTVIAKTAMNEPDISTLRSSSTKSKNAASCELQAKQITCGNQKFQLIGNKANHRLASNALSIDNKMALPKFQGGVLGHYLAQAYTQYIDKMCDIGLGGVTMTYGKFAYLYQDLLTKGLDFTERFEIMYGFLKKDKANMGVSEASVVPTDLSLQNCTALTNARYVCDHKGRNYIFAAQ